MKTSEVIYWTITKTQLRLNMKMEKKSKSTYKTCKKVMENKSKMLRCVLCFTLHCNVHVSLSCAISPRKHNTNHSHETSISPSLGQRHTRRFSHHRLCLSQFCIKRNETIQAQRSLMSLLRTRRMVHSKLSRQ